MEERGDELSMLDVIDEVTNFFLSTVVTFVIFGALVVLVVPKADTESSLLEPNKPRWRISGMEREFVLSPMLSIFFSHPLLCKQSQ